ncbi:MAG: DUF4837 family protein [Gemmatimonadota bacterium]
MTRCTDSRPSSPAPASRTAASRLPIPWAVALAFLTAGCGKPSSFGEANSLIVVAPDSLWSQVSEETYARLEPTIFTTREEKKFVVTHVDPASPQLGQLLLWRQVLVFAPPRDERLDRILRAAGRKGERGPAIVQAEDVWALDQLATAVVLEAGRERESWRELLPELARTVDEQYRDYVRRRMFVSGVDSATAETLERRFGFSIQVPRVYRLVLRESAEGGDIAILRNDNPDPSELIRSILIQARPRADSLAPEAVAEWRESVDGVHYNIPQRIDRSRGSERSLTVGGRPAVEVTGTWIDEGGAVPAAGPFIARAVQCSKRTVFLDAWLYAPQRSKYEYMLQLEEILGSFRCD